ncbi:transposase [Luteolibacter arcticus]|uniref:Transposase n=1 Tax=Luteolibacter arcticus TaxID=1581411 RepID=A0ABT3GGG9_9BACT|nr:transposase [Luteolibacter arcticus]MCW1922119.1 transposase [Luteolibacter arcticus]
MHKGIHDRGYLPHWDFEDSVQAITFRLGDALPTSVIEEWRRELAGSLGGSERHLSPRAQTDLHRRIARYEDAGHGSGVLAMHECAAIVQGLLLAGHDGAYKLIEWCIMPNHVHVLVRLTGEIALGQIVKGWKAPAAIQINRLLGRSGSLWLEDYHDRFIRDLDHFHNAVAYIRENPVKAGLCKTPAEWRFSSAGIGWGTGSSPHEGRTRAE